jgi:hypothetical protein
MAGADSPGDGEVPRALFLSPQPMRLNEDAKITPAANQVHSFFIALTSVSSLYVYAMDK